MKACVLTWGCQLNQHRSEELEGVLAGEGYVVLDQPDQADVVILNTCMVRGRAEDKAQGRLAQLAGARTNGRPLLGVGGCMAQGRTQEMAETFPHADFVFGTRNLDEVPRLVVQAAQGERAVSIPSPGRDDRRLPVRRRSSIQAYVAVAEGCSQRCAYCVVPFVRGPLRSRPLEDVLAELDHLAARGYQEVTLLGQNVDAYGTDRPGGPGFAMLLKRAAETGIPRIRFTSSHPAFITEEVLATMAEEPTVCEHLHLAVQSGSDRILKAMGRGHTRARLENIIARAYSAVPGINLTTDVIVGFPGETERDFRETLDLVERAMFGTVYAAAYSPRPHTPARRLPDDVPEEVKGERLARILEASRRNALALHNRRLGETVEVLVEGKLRAKGMWYGKTRDFRTVLFPSESTPLAGRTVSVVIEGASTGGMQGRLQEAQT